MQEFKHARECVIFFGRMQARSHATRGVSTNREQNKKTNIHTPLESTREAKERLLIIDKNKKRKTKQSKKTKTKKTLARKQNGRYRDTRKEGQTGKKRKKSEKQTKGKGGTKRDKNRAGGKDNTKGRHW